MSTRGPNRRTSTIRFARWAMALAIGCVGCSRPADNPVDRAAARIAADRIDTFGRKLSGDDMEGRYYASPEADTAASFIVARLRQLRIASRPRAELVLGPEPATFVHQFSVTLYRIGDGTRLDALGPGNERAAVLGGDYLPLVFARSAVVEAPVVRVDAKMLLATAASPLAGRIALLPHALEAQESGESREATLYRLAFHLQEAGAAAVLLGGGADLLHTSAAVYPSYLTPELQVASTSARGTAANLHADRLSLVAQAQAWRDAPRRTLPAAVVRSAWLERLQDDDRVRLQVDLDPEVSLGQNVLVGFRGRSRPDEIVVVGTNYDHAGVNAAGDVLNGADDNASGVAALLEVAGALYQVRDSLQRSVLLVFFSAGRQGLQGAETLLHDLPQLLGTGTRPVAMLSLRGIGRNGSHPMLLVGADRSPGLAAMLEKFDTRERLRGAPLLLQRAGEESVGMARLEIVPSHASEHLSFARGGVPSILLSDGLDPMLYGQPEDDWKDVDPDKVARVARLVFSATQALAADLHTPTAAAAARP
jgi:hypothetical protein